MSSMRNAVTRRPHKERSQPKAREKWGILEKHKVRPFFSMPRTRATSTFPFRKRKHLANHLLYVHLGLQPPRP